MSRRASGVEAVPIDIPALMGSPYLPLYRRVCETFARMIADGRWRPGDALPAETDIARAYNIAPGTVRRALDELADNRLIERRQGIGTFVHRPNFDNAMLRFFRFRGVDGAAFVPESRVVALGIAACPPAPMEALGLTEPQAVLLVRHRIWDGAVRLIERIYLPPRRFAALLDAKPDEIGPLLYPAYERICGQVVFQIEEEIAILEASPEDAAELQLQSGDLVFSIERVARDATGAAIEWRVSRGDARRFRYQVSPASAVPGGGHGTI